MPCKKVEGANIGEWTQDYDAAVALAKKNESTVILNFTGSDWCGWCQLMDEKVFHHKDFPAIAKGLNLVMVYLDFPSDSKLVPEKFKKRNSELQSKFGVGGYPTYIVLTHELEKIGKLGAGRDKTPKSFGDEIQAVINKSPAAMKKKAAELGDKGPAFLASYETFKAKEKALKDWIGTSPARNDENMKKYEEFQVAIAMAKSAFESYY